MIEPHHPTLDADRLTALLGDDVRRHHRNGTAAISLEALAILLKAAEDRSAPRTQLPDKLNRFPFTWSKTLQRIFLKLHALLFADQREVNRLLIQTLKQSLAALRDLEARLNRLADASADERTRP
jgi:O-antigen chain-terminating methyltransferase